MAPRVCTLVLSSCFWYNCAKCFFYLQGSDPSGACIVSSESLRVLSIGFKEGIHIAITKASMCRVPCILLDSTCAEPVSSMTFSIVVLL